jgi:opacity protein-like surface antigen
MKNIIIATLTMVCLVIFKNTSQAQLEAGISVGLSTYQGDLAPNSISGSFSQLHFSGGVFGRYNVNNYIAAKLAVNYAKLSASDANAATESQQRRNLSFRSNVFEGALTAEFNILGYQPYNFERTFSPYIFAGVAFFHYDPQAFIDNEWVNLQPLGTEGQGIDGFEEEYNLYQFAIPFGIGVKYALNDQWNIGLEVGLRKTFTDYIDDVSGVYGDNSVIAAGNGELAAALNDRSGEITNEPVVRTPDSQRGNADKDDSYIITGIFISYNFADNGLVGGRRKSKRKTGCPTF